MATIEKLKKRINKEKKYIVSEESALDQLALILDYYDVDLDSAEDEEEKAGEEELFDNLISSIRLGKIEIKTNDKNVPILTQITSGGNRLDYVNSIATARANLDFKDKKHFKSNYQFAGSLCGVGEDGIRNLDRKDSRVAEYISSFFLKL